MKKIIKTKNEEFYNGIIITKTQESKFKKLSIHQAEGIGLELDLVKYKTFESDHDRDYWEMSDIHKKSYLIGQAIVLNKEKEFISILDKIND